VLEGLEREAREAMKGLYSPGMKTVWKVSNPTLRRSMRPIPIGVHSSLGQLARGKNHEM